jgi:hypothetical protein
MIISKILLTYIFVYWPYIGSWTAKYSSSVSKFGWIDNIISYKMNKVFIPNGFIWYGENLISCLIVSSRIFICFVIAIMTILIQGLPIVIVRSDCNRSTRFLWMIGLRNIFVFSPILDNIIQRIVIIIIINLIITTC